MSQSPIDDFSERTVMRYRQGWKALSRLLHEDRSFSGHERNCAFLNTGDENSHRFADISAASGLDFADDGRAVALSDWDFDGDLDIWVTNRTAPRIRLLRNNSPRNNHFLAIKLQGDGQRVNRDAIGARVEVVLADTKPRPFIKTLSAGDSFLSQSSSWLHFGLGEANAIRHVDVRWPDGTNNRFKDLEIDQRYIIDRQSGQATRWTTPEERKILVASPQVPQELETHTRTVLPARRLLPTLRVDGLDDPINSNISKPTVITIWTASCNLCIAELKEYALHADQIRQAGLDVIAVNLDNLQDGLHSGETILTDIKFPFATASGTIELVRSLDILKRAIFDRWQTLNVPTSFLVDDRGFVCVVYQGPVEVGQLLSDLKLLQVSSEELRRFATPFPGQWITPPPTADPLQVTTHFVDEAMVTSGIEYLERHARIVEETSPDERSQEPGDLYYVLAVLLRDQEQVDESLDAFRKAIKYRPNDFRFRSEFASILAKTGQLDEAAEQLMRCLQINDEDVAVQRKLAFIRMAQRNPSAAIRRFSNVLKARPDDVACWYNLANAYRADGQLDEAMNAYRHTLKLQPNMALAANNLAWILSTHPNEELRDGEEAVNWASRVCEQTEHAHPGFLDTLACAHAEIGDFEKAIEMAARAVSIYEENGRTDAAASIQNRLQLFRQNQPFRATIR